MKRLLFLVIFLCWTGVCFAADYKLISTKVDGETLTSEVEYTFKDGTKQIISVPAFMPETKEDVILGIENRLVSEQRRVDAEKKNLTIKTELDSSIARVK